MKIYKIASSYFDMLIKARECIEQAYEVIGKGQLRTNDKNPSFEFRDESDPRGTNYIQVYFNEQEQVFGVSKYYESESMQNEYGQDLQVPFDSKTCVESIVATVRKLESM
jgi:hypothetical protein